MHLGSVSPISIDERFSKLCSCPHPQFHPPTQKLSKCLGICRNLRRFLTFHGKSKPFHITKNYTVAPLHPSLRRGNEFRLVDPLRAQALLKLRYARPRNLLFKFVNAHKPKSDPVKNERRPLFASCITFSNGTSRFENEALFTHSNLTNNLS